jgi:hypothetical protein
MEIENEKLKMKNVEWKTQYLEFRMKYKARLLQEWKRRMDYEKFRAYSLVKKIKNVGQLRRNVEWSRQYAKSRMKYEGCMM